MFDRWIRGDPAQDDRTFLHVVLPQALRQILPVYRGEFPAAPHPGAPSSGKSGPSRGSRRDATRAAPPGGLLYFTHGRRAADRRGRACHGGRRSRGGPDRKCGRRPARRPRDDGRRSRSAAGRSSSPRWTTSSAARGRRSAPGTSRCSASWRRRVKKKASRRATLAALRLESERAERDMIRRWQALPPEKRTNFLRKKVGLRASAL